MERGSRRLVPINVDLLSLEPIQVPSAAGGAAMAAAGGAAAAAPPNDGDDEGPLASMPLDVLQKILLQVPLESRLKPAFAAKFLWLAASSPTAAGASSAASSPLGPLLPPAALGPPGAFEPTPAAGPKIFPPKAASKKKNRY